MAADVALILALLDRASIPAEVQIVLRDATSDRDQERIAAIVMAAGFMAAEGTEVRSNCCAVYVRGLVSIEVRK